ncbi:hypothetical protein RhiirC2_783635 [Rhizophagus irregularis]|uniref:Uncharacterized protein n=1 Tax=Rhizophagus irregularis TaxID=588596 RepID=A0A2N1N0A7_9GLOM|nr:hypothetical protein RhiirC2_783635 [Rhizophagus irregularis]
METNHHLWRCHNILPHIPHIREVFKYLAVEAENIIRKDADKLSLCISDSIKYSNTFNYIHRDSDEDILHIRSYVTHDLSHIFKSHFNTQKSAHKAIMAFLHVSLL